VFLGAPAGPSAACGPISRAKWIEDGAAPIRGAHHFSGLLEKGGGKPGAQLPAAGRCRMCPAARTLARWSLQMAGAEVQHCKIFQRSDAEASIHAAAGCPHVGEGAGRYSACSARLPFPGEWRSAQAMIATVSSGLRHAGRKLGP